MLINLRNALMTGKRWKNPYITDGLIAMWDGEWNAGGGVHDPNATTWKDLVGGNDFVNFKTGVLFGDNYIRIPNSLNAATAGSAYDLSSVNTIEAVVSLSAWNGLVLVSFTSGTPLSRWIGFRANGTVNFGHNQTCAQLNASVNVKMHIAGTFNEGLWNIYKNGQSISSAGAGMTWPTIGKTVATLNAAASSYSQSDVYSLRVSSRALTADEIARNYAIDKARFGLP